MVILATSGCSGSQHHEGRAPDGVRPRGEDLQRVTGLQREAQARPLGAADPVALHGLDALGPVERLGVAQQLLGVVGDAEVPLLEVALEDLRAAALADVPFEDLLVGEDGLVLRAPPDGALGAVGQTPLQHLQEEPLVPAVELGSAAGDLPAPVDHGPHLVVLLAHGGDVLEGPDGGVDAVADGGVLGGQSEGVEPHREEDVVAAHALQAGVDVGYGEGVPVADVEDAGGIGVHGQGVPLVAGGIVVDPVEVVPLPALAPLLLDYGRIVTLGAVGGG